MRTQFLEWAGLPVCMADNILGWDVHPLEIDGKLVAIGMTNGTEIHFAATPALRGLVVTRKRLADYLGPLLERRGFLTTRVADGSDADFIERLGFEPTWSEPGTRYYMLCDVPFKRAA